MEHLSISSFFNIVIEMCFFLHSILEEKKKEENISILNPALLTYWTGLWKTSDSLKIVVLFWKRSSVLTSN